MSLQEKLLDQRKQFEAGAPPEVLEIMHRATNDLDQSGIMEGVLKVGDAMPAFELPDSQNRIVLSKDLLKEGPLALYFYRGIW